MISRKETESQRINHKVAQQYTDEEHHCSDSQCFTHTLSLIRIKGGIDAERLAAEKNRRRSTKTAEEIAEEEEAERIAAEEAAAEERAAAAKAAAGNAATKK